MNHYISVMKTFFITHKKKFITGLYIFLGLAAIAFVVALIIYNTPKTYQAAKACDLLTPAKAQDLLGDKVISLESNAPIISGDTATSKCSYTDSNPDKNKMMVAAIAVRSGINDKGVLQNKNTFMSNKAANKNVETVNGLDGDAYFNAQLGQLNILRNREWIILSYGVGTAPETNTIEGATKLANTVFH